jgi:hypothetical protein
METSRADTIRYRDGNGPHDLLPVQLIAAAHEKGLGVIILPRLVIQRPKPLETHRTIQPGD